jgi:hypothetical protein
VDWSAGLLHGKHYKNFLVEPCICQSLKHVSVFFLAALWVYTVLWVDSSWLYKHTVSGVHLCTHFWRCAYKSAGAVVEEPVGNSVHTPAFLTHWELEHFAKLHWFSQHTPNSQLSLAFWTATALERGAIILLWWNLFGLTDSLSNPSPAYDFAVILDFIGRQFHPSWKSQSISHPAIYTFHAVISLIYWPQSCASPPSLNNFFEINLED